MSRHEARSLTAHVLSDVGVRDLCIPQASKLGVRVLMRLERVKSIVAFEAIATDRYNGGNDAIGLRNALKPARSCVVRCPRGDGSLKSADITQRDALRHRHVESELVTSRDESRDAPSMIDEHGQGLPHLSRRTSDLDVIVYRHDQHVRAGSFCRFQRFLNGCSERKRAKWTTLCAAPLRQPPHPPISAQSGDLHARLQVLQ